MKIIRYILPLIILLLNFQSSKAVLKGDDLNETVIMLNSELEVFSDYVDATTSNFMDARKDYKNKMKDFRNDLTSAKLSLYSQQGQYIFGNAYASEYASKVCEGFHKDQLPIDLWKTTYQRAISRCTQLQKTLGDINPDALSPKAQSSRAKGLEHLDNVLNTLHCWRDTVIDDLKNYDILTEQVKTLQADIDNNYDYILNTMLMKPDKHPTHKVFDGNFAKHWKACAATLAAIFTSSNYYGWEFQYKWTSQFHAIFLAGIIAFIIGFLLGAFVLLKRIAKYWAQISNHPYIFNTFCGWITISLTYLVMKIWFTTNPFFVSALNLAIEMCLLLIFLFCSMMLRVKSNQLVPTLMTYVPTVIISLIIIFYRVALVDINVIRITYPILLMILIAMQIIGAISNWRKIPKLDRYVSLGAIALFSWCFGLCFFGYYYMSIHIALAWSLYIIGFLLLTCYYYLLNGREKKLRNSDEEAYLKSWRPITYKRLFRPIAFIGVVVISTLECAHVFNINDWLNNVYNFDFIHYPGIVCLSMKRIVNIILFGILIHFLVGFVNYLLRRHYKEKADVGAMNLARNISVIIVWGAYIVIALAYIEVNSIGIIATLGGLAVGLGVALRDTFDCLLCGIILMMGRIKIGDVVEVGSDVRGKVIDIQYRTTLIETDDGAIISVFNTQFFGKDFRNVSYSGKYQRLHIEFRVQKEIDAPEIRKTLAQALVDNVPELAQSPAPKILFGGTDRFHVDMIAQVWVPVMDYYEAISNVKETLFNTLKANGMSNMSVDTRVRLIKNIVEPAEETPAENKSKK